MQGVAIHIDPEPCVDVHEGGSEASARERIGQPLSPAKIHIPGADTIAKVEGDSDRGVSASAGDLRGRLPRVLCAAETRGKEFSGMPTVS